MPRTHVILDGLADPEHGRLLSAAWARAGLDNGVDVAGQSAWLSKRAGETDEADGNPSTGNPSTGDPSAGDPSGGEPALTEADLAHASQLARGFGLEPRDRVGEAFKAGNELPPLRDRVAREYRGRLAQAVMFGLPAVALQYLAPLLASGGAGDARGLLFPWVMQLLLVGWMLVAAGWPILWQGALALIHLRATPDLLTSIIVAAAFVPSAVGVLSMILTPDPWFGPPLGDGGPAFHAAAIVIALALAQRWRSHAHGETLAGRANLMPRHVGRLVIIWITLATLVAIGLALSPDSNTTAGWKQGLAVAMLMPAMLAHGGINRWSPGWSAALPVFAFAGFYLVAPGAWGMQVQGVRIEIAACFGLVMTAVFEPGWRR